VVELEVAVEERLALSEFKVEGWRRPVTPRVDFFAEARKETMEDFRLLAGVDIDMWWYLKMNGKSWS